MPPLARPMMEAIRRYMPDTNNRNLEAVNEEDATESRMRRALGLRGPAGQAPQQRADQARARHKFVQDGGVPVVMINSRGDQDSAARARVAELESQLEAERNAHAATRRALLDAQANAQNLQTRLAHAELAHREALAAAQETLGVAQQATQDAQRSATEAVPKAPRPTMRKTAVERTPRDREPQPVKWWTPTYRARSKAK